jgi:hypothetical protein
MDDRAFEVFKNVINERRKEDPLIGAKIGAREVRENLMTAMKDSRGVHIESLLCALGSLAGYSCQASLRKELIEMKGLDESQVFVILNDKEGNKYYYGDLINKPLYESQYSVWSLLAGAVQELGKKELIDAEDIFKYVVNTIGTDNFGIPRIPEDHKPMDIPLNFVKYLWPRFLPIAETFCAFPSEWPIMFGLAVQQVILMGKDVIDPLLALSIAMESAIPMAKVDINRK